MTLDEITRLCRAYVAARDRLAVTVGDVKDEQRKVVRAKLRSIRAAVSAMADARDELKAALIEGRALFDRPRTRTLAGIKVGWQKQKGKVELLDNDERTIARIRRKHPDLAETLIRTTETVDKEALRKAPAKVLASVGATLVEDGDKAVIRDVAAEVERLVDALLDDLEDRDDEIEEGCREAV